LAVDFGSKRSTGSAPGGSGIGNLRFVAFAAGLGSGTKLTGTGDRSAVTAGIGGSGLGGSGLSGSGLGGGSGSRGAGGSGSAIPVTSSARSGTAASGATCH
jgi:hypothetical protein